MKNYDSVAVPEDVSTKQYTDGRIEVGPTKPTNGAKIWMNTSVPDPTGPQGGNALDQATADTRYVKLSGGTMTGMLVGTEMLAANPPTAVAHLTRKDYVDARAVRVFSNAAERDSIIPSPTEGTTCWLSDIHQQQTWRIATTGIAAGWYPTGGIMPAGEIGSSSAGQSFSASTYTKMTFASITPSTLQGGLTWDSANNCFVGPAGWYLVQVRAFPASNAAASQLTFSAGSSAATFADQNGVYIPASTAPATGAVFHYRQESTGTYSTIAGWLHSTVARDITYRTLRATYLSQM